MRVRTPAAAAALAASLVARAAHDTAGAVAAAGAVDRRDAARLVRAVAALAPHTAPRWVGDPTTAAPWAGDDVVDALIERMGPVLTTRAVAPVLDHVLARFRATADYDRLAVLGALLARYHVGSDRGTLEPLVRPLRVIANAMTPTGVRPLDDLLPRRFTRPLRGLPGTPENALRYHVDETLRVLRPPAPPWPWPPRRVRLLTAAGWYGPLGRLLVRHLLQPEQDVPQGPALAFARRLPPEAVAAVAAAAAGSALRRDRLRPDAVRLLADVLDVLVGRLPDGVTAAQARVLVRYLVQAYGGTRPDAGRPDRLAGAAVVLARHLSGGPGPHLSAEDVAGLSLRSGWTPSRLVAALAEREAAAPAGPARQRLAGVVGDLVTAFDLEVSPDDLGPLLRFVARHPGTDAAAGLVDRVVQYRRVMEPVAAELRAVAARYPGHERLRRAATALDVPRLWPTGGLADRILDDLAALGPRWRPVVACVATASGARPSPSWTRRATAALAGVAAPEAAEVLLRWVVAAGGPQRRRPQDTDERCGVLWLLATTGPGDAATGPLGAIVEVMQRRLPGVGVTSAKLARVAVEVLAGVDGPAADAELTRLADKVTHPATRTLLREALAGRAAGRGLSADDLAEAAVPGFGFAPGGVRTVAAGTCRAVLTVRGTAVDAQWFGAGGRAVRRPPAAARRDHPAAVAEVRDTVRAATATLAARRARLDRAYLDDRVWRGAGWRRHYLEHPLLATLAGRLIWLVDGTPVSWTDGELRAVDGAPCRVGDDAEVRLWHPAGRPADEVRAWRARLEHHGVVQPFAQAHREVYEITPAERASDPSSARFAGHVLRQHRFRALAAARGWDTGAVLTVHDGGRPDGVACRSVPPGDVQVRYHVEGVGEQWDTEVTADGVHRYVGTGRVVFSRPLDEVPAVVFSEVMRDLDLFTGVAGVGTDPFWTPAGPPDGGHALGPLSATALTRREVLARLVPRLAVADRATVGERFLTVRGDLHTYRIHLGSGAVLISPHHRHLCIVPRHTAPEPGVVLPFEGDAMLTVILSKAVLLAGDAAITDPEILDQLG